MSYINQPIENRDKVIATMATYPNRLNLIMSSVNSIINQVDELWIYLNGYKEIPDVLKIDKVKCFLGINHLGDLKAKGKFYKSHEINGYHFTIDDDLIYPNDYVDLYIKALQKYDNKIYVTTLGKIIKNNPTDYYRNYGLGIMYYEHITNDTWVHIPGTGVSAYHSDVLTIDFDSINGIGFVDLFIGLDLQKNMIPVLIPKHIRNWIKPNPNINVKDTLYTKNFLRGKKQTEILKSHKWLLFSPNGVIENPLNKGNKPNIINNNVVLSKSERQKQIREAVQLKKNKNTVVVNKKNRKQKGNFDKQSLEAAKNKILKQPKDSVNQFKKEMKAVKANKKRIVIKRKHR